MKCKIFEGRLRVLRKVTLAASLRNDVNCAVNRYKCTGCLQGEREEANGIIQIYEAAFYRVGPLVHSSTLINCDSQASPLLEILLTGDVRN